MLYEILLVLALAYAAQMMLFAVALLKVHCASDPVFRPRVSVIIAARNEERNIGKCMESLAHLTYPKALLEVIVVDDRSEDATRSIVGEFAERHGFLRLVVAAPGKGDLKGKTNAVTQGIECSTGDILLFTDADCTVPVNWVEETVKYYTDGKVGIVAGFTSLENRNWFQGMQALDWFFLFSVASAALRLRFPVTAVGTNLSIRRTAYDKVGGYRNIPFSVTEDYALFRAVTSTTDFSARFPMDAGMLVSSQACATWKELYLQKKRWFVGGRNTGAVRLLAFGMTYCLHIALLLSLAVSGPDTLVIPLGLKVGADLFASMPSLVVFERLSLLRYLIHFQMYCIAYVLVFPLVVLFGRRVVWKERSLG